MNAVVPVNLGLGVWGFYREPQSGPAGEEHQDWAVCTYGVCGICRCCEMQCSVLAFRVCLLVHTQGAQPRYWPSLQMGTAADASVGLGWGDLWGLSSWEGKENPQAAESSGSSSHL